jgi:hypothetical protein
MSSGSSIYAESCGNDKQELTEWLLRHEKHQAKYLQPSALSYDAKISDATTALIAEIKQSVVCRDKVA